MIEEAECVLRDLGFHDVRVRHHELRPEFRSSSSETDQRNTVRGPEGNGKSPPAHNGRLALARIEVGSDEMKRLLGEGVPAKISESLRSIGYAHVTLDLSGYRRGSLNEQIVSIKESKRG
jgi:uncharacterized protein